jgi:hypothetical protein
MSCREKQRIGNVQAASQYRSVKFTTRDDTTSAKFLNEANFRAASQPDIIQTELQYSISKTWLLTGTKHQEHEDQSAVDN